MTAWCWCSAGAARSGSRLPSDSRPGSVVVLAARRADELDEEAARVRAAGASAVHCIEFDADDTAAPPGAGSSSSPPSTDGSASPCWRSVCSATRHAAERDPAHALAVVHTDFVAQVSVLTVLATLMRAPGSGQLVVFSSVAGIRVRRANYVYGSAKAGLDGFASGLGDALHGSGVRLLLVRPGFVIGRMTEGMDPAPLSSTPGQVADAVVDGLRHDRSRVWVPSLLRPAFFVARLVPQAVWRRMPR